MLRIDGSLYRPQHELVFVLKSGSAPHINNVELGRYGRYRTNVWQYAGANAFSATRDGDLAMHPTMKPVALVADAILDCSRRSGLVLDAFAGVISERCFASTARRWSPPSAPDSREACFQHDAATASSSTRFIAT